VVTHHSCARFFCIISWSFSTEKVSDRQRISSSWWDQILNLSVCEQSLSLRLLASFFDRPEITSNTRKSSISGKRSWLSRKGVLLFLSHMSLIGCVCSFPPRFHLMREWDFTLDSPEGGGRNVWITVHMYDFFSLKLTFFRDTFLYRRRSGHFWR
jgi:hypothetical protein